MADTPEMDYGAISLDTSVIERSAFRFNHGNLKEMAQFKNSPVQVVQTEIVHHECLAHYAKQLSSAAQDIEGALRTARLHLHINHEAIERAKQELTLSDSESSIAGSNLTDFYSSIDAHVLPSSQSNVLTTLIPMYFEGEPPFDTSGNKKHEFPDALALLSLEQWAEENRINVVAVSSDKGWSRYATTSPRITVIDNLGEALEKFQPHNKVAEIISKIQEDEILDEDNHVVESIRDEIISRVEAVLPWVEADSAFVIEDQYASIEYESHDFERSEDGTIHINVVRISEAEIVIQAKANVDLKVDAEFAFSVKDSIDKDYVNMGSNTYQLKHEFHTDVVVTLRGDFSKGIDHIVASEVDVSEPDIDIHLGEIEPSWRSDPESYM